MDDDQETWRDWILEWVCALAISAVVLLFIATLVFEADAHQAQSGMTYPSKCCSGYDCAPIKNVVTMPDGSAFITLENGDSAMFPPGFPIEPSTDGRDHACIGKYSSKPLCRFGAAGV